MLEPLLRALEDPALAIPFTFVISLMVGSFLNVVIYRLPKILESDWKHQSKLMLEVIPPDSAYDPELTLSKPASTCPACQHKIRWYENIPVLSYLYLGGKCSACKTSISMRYPVVELMTALLSVSVVFVMGPTLIAACLVAITWVLVALTMIDFDTQLLPDNLTLPLLWAGLIANSFGLITELDQALWGAVAGYMSLWTIYQLYKLLTGKEGMGYGDFKLLAALGAWMGWQLILPIVLISALVGSIVGITMMLVLGRDKQIPIAFGPYLAIAGWICLLWGDSIVSLWFSQLS